ncbi:MAG: glycosyltransferase family 39 protein, partial [Erythrobacter sp.]
MIADYLTRRLSGTWLEPPRPLSKRYERIFFGLTLAAIGFAVAVRLYGINYSLWGDEIASTVFAREPVWRLWSDWIIRETNPPLFYTILHYWILVFGQSDVTVKLLATIFGVANIIVVAVIARQLGGSWLPALVTVLFVSVNPSHILYSQNARAFTLGAFAASIVCLMLIRIMRKHENTSANDVTSKDWGLFGLALLISLYTHTT